MNSFVSMKRGRLVASIKVWILLVVSGTLVWVTYPCEDLQTPKNNTRGRVPHLLEILESPNGDIEQYENNQTTTEDSHGLNTVHSESEHLQVINEEHNLPQNGKRKFLINNPGLCKRVIHLKLFIFVQMNVDNFEGRKYLRERWFNQYLFKQPHVAVAFMVGVTENHNASERLVREARRFGDIIQGDFIDTYKSQAVKNIGAFQWILEHCQEATYIMKTDEDVFLNIVLIMKYLEDNTLPQDSIDCCWDSGTVRRKGKFKVSPLDFPNSSYPDYCSGPMYLFHRKVAEKLYAEALATPRSVWIEDVYITGILRVNANISFMNSHRGACFWQRGPTENTMDQYLDCNKRIIHYASHRNDHQFHKDFNLMWAAAIQRLPDSTKSSLNTSVLTQTAEVFPGCL